MEIHFLNPVQSSFRNEHRTVTVNQLVFIIHKIYEALEQGKEVRMVFLDISKAFFLSLYRSDPLLKWINKCLSNRMQHVVIDVQLPDCMKPAYARVRFRRSVIFKLYDSLWVIAFLYIDDTSLFQVANYPTLTAINLNNDLERINAWTSDYLVTILIQAKISLYLFHWTNKAKSSKYNF